MSASSNVMMSQLHLSLLLVFLIIVPICNSQNQNIETFFPNETTSPSPAPAPPISPPPPPSRQQPVQAPAEETGSSSSNRRIATAVAATAASTLVVSGLLFFLIRRCLKKRRREEIGRSRSSGSAAPGDRRVVPQMNEFERIEGNVRGLIVDEDGLDVIYWRKLEGKNNSKKGLQKEVVRHSSKNKEREQGKEKEKQEVELQEEGDGYGGNDQGKKSEPVQEIPLLRGMSSTSHIDVLSEDEHESNRSTRRNLSKRNSLLSPPRPLPPAALASAVSPPLPPPPSAYFSAIPKAKSPEPPPPPPPPLILARENPAPPPPPPPIPAKKSPAPPPAPPMAGGSRSSSKPPPAPIEMPGTAKPSGEGMSGTGNDKMKLKPLHWDKVNTDADHSMVWDKLDRGSFRVDQDLMEALFGFVATTRRSPKGKNNSTIPNRDASAPLTKISILDSRKSQNIAIVLKSLAVSREEILDALHEGQGLSADTIEKLARVAPTEEEQSDILEFRGDPSRLPAAESFLYDILKAVPSAFKRLNAMLFRLNYDSEILEIKESLNTIELGSKELRNRGLFVKLLEAVLKAGNRMNAGTSRGNAQAFNLSSLRKLSDVKSTNGKTTLLHFVVEEVVRSEGKRCVLNRDRSLIRSSSRRRNSNGEAENSVSDEQREKEYLTLGLPFVGGISSEFSNVKKAALIDYSTLVASISALSSRVAEIQELVSQCGNGSRGGNFVREMEHFLRNAKEELRSVRDEQTRVMQLMKRTAEYYQGGASKDAAENLQLFVIVKDFLGMVDQACVDIARNMQKRKITKANSG